MSLIPPVAYGIAVHPLFDAWLGYTFFRGSGEPVAIYPETSASA